MQPKQILLLALTLGVTCEAKVLSFGRSENALLDKFLAKRNADGKEAADASVSTSPGKAVVATTGAATATTAVVAAAVVSSSTHGEGGGSPVAATTSAAASATALVSGGATPHSTTAGAPSPTSSVVHTGGLLSLETPSTSAGPTPATTSAVHVLVPPLSPVSSEVVVVPSSSLASSFGDDPVTLPGERRSTTSAIGGDAPVTLPGERRSTTSAADVAAHPTSTPSGEPGFLPSGFSTAVLRSATSETPAVAPTPSVTHAAGGGGGGDGGDSGVGGTDPFDILNGLSEEEIKELLCKAAELFGFAIPALDC